MPETPDDQKRTGTPDDERNVRIDVNIGGLVGNMNELLNAVNQAMQEMQRQFDEQRKSGWKVENDPEKGTFGFSFSTNLNDFVQSGGTTRTTVRSSASSVRSRTTVQSSAASSRATATTEPQVREPLVDLFDEGDEIIVVAEMPGVQMSDIRVILHEDVLALETTGERRYMKELLLPAAVDPTTIKQTYRNGILELRLQRQQP